ncbi:MAG: DUF4097 family beta strand repeat-containing protein [Actinomycetota bacterium]
MTRTSLDELVELDLDGIREAHIHIISGAVAATAGAAPGVVRVRFDADCPVHVSFDDGVLEVRRDPLSGGWLRFREDVVVELTAPDDVLVRAGVVSASVVVRGFADHVDAQTVSGPVTLDDLSGPVRVKTVSGDIEARALHDTLSVNTVSGDVTLVDGDCAEVEAKTVSGDVLLDLRVDPAGSYRVTTLSGDVGLRVDDDEPPVHVKTMSGKVSTVRTTADP